ncbi:MAG: AAA family ATPase [Candidatus Moranbacteria bacterium]|nr:AAA family ATPase [Candidatus Moranbacteria bacterium]
MINIKQKESILNNLKQKASNESLGQTNDQVKGFDFKKRFNPISISDLLKMEIPSTDWLVERLVPKEGITIIAGPPGNFKTWIMFNMAINISRGEKLFDNFKTQKTNILLIDEENHLRLIKQRILMLGGDPDLNIQLISKKNFIITDKNILGKMINFCKKEKIGLVIIDSLVRIHSNDENSAREMNVVFRHLGQFCKHGITVVISHHEKKEGMGKMKASSRLRGSTDILASCDSLISVKAKENNSIIEIKQPKSREEESINPFELRVCKDYDLVDFQYIGQKEKTKTNDEIIMEILKNNPDGLLKKDIEEIADNEYKVSKYQVRESLKRLEETGEINCKKGRGTSRIFSFIEEDNQSNLEF